MGKRYMRGIAVSAVAMLLIVSAVAAWWLRGDQDEPQVDANGSRAGLSVSGDTAKQLSSSSPTPVAITLPPREASTFSDAWAVAELAAKQDARKDDWHTEVLSDLAMKRLSLLEVAILNSDKSRTIDLLVHDEFACPPLRPDNLVEVYRDANFVVRRLPSNAPPRDLHTGAEGLRVTLEPLRAALGTSPERNAKFKLFRVKKDPKHFTTWVQYEASSQGQLFAAQQRAVWTCRWTYPSDVPPRLLRIDLESYEEAESRLPGGTLFADCTESALGDDPSYRQQVVPGINHWLARVPREFMSQFGHNGIAVGDVNDDGLDDIYVCDSGGLPNRLYVQQTDGTARDVSEEAGVDFLDDSSSALLLDLDNDGDQDLVVAADPILQIVENDGRGNFHLKEPIKHNTNALTLSAADFDSDGDLDLFVCGYNVRQKEPTDRGLPFPLPYHDARNGGRNVLLRNEGGLQFIDATREVGLDVANSRFSMASAWEDFDNDGDQDLYVANDFGPNNLYRNDGGFFTDIAAAVGVEDHASGMSVSWGDYNRDGWMDLYVGNMFSAAGNRVTYQRQFEQGKSSTTVNLLRRMARGNTLFANVGHAGRDEFLDASLQEAVEMGRWAWSSKFLDFTNDGWPDLVVANGYVTGTDHDDL